MSSALDPDRLRATVLDALHRLPGEAELDALHAVERGEIDIEDDPLVDELQIRIGDVTVIVDRRSCEQPAPAEAPGPGSVP